MSLVSYLKIHAAPPVAARFIRALGATLRVRTLGEAGIAEARRRGGALIFIFWHGRQFYPAYHFRGRDITILSSRSVDGEMQARILGRLGYPIARGSSNRGAVGGLKALADTLLAGRDVALAVDGPRGPAGVVKEGLTLLARKTGAWVVPLAAAFERERVFERSWDRYRLPRAGSRGVFLLGRPFRADDVLHPERLHTLAGRALDALHAAADALHAAATPRAAAGGTAEETMSESNELKNNVSNDPEGRP